MKPTAVGFITLTTVTFGRREHTGNTVVKRSRVPAGSLVKMAMDAASLRPGLCEL